MLANGVSIGRARALARGEREGSELRLGCGCGWCIHRQRKSSLRCLRQRAAEFFRMMATLRGSAWFLAVVATTHVIAGGTGRGGAKCGRCEGSFARTWTTGSSAHRRERNTRKQLGQPKVIKIMYWKKRCLLEEERQLMLQLRTEDPGKCPNETQFAMPVKGMMRVPACCGCSVAGRTVQWCQILLLRCVPPPVASLGTKEDEG